MNNKLTKILTITVVFVLGVFGATATAAYAAPDSHWGNPPGSTQTYGPGMMRTPNYQTNPYCTGTGDASAILALPKEDLSAAENEALAFMFEEEKLARDVYNALAEKWNGGVFSMIAQAEQQHMDSVSVLLDKYGISYEELPAGEFANAELQALYTELVAKGSLSIAEAYQVGALIEETDIRDLIDLQKVVDNQDILLVFQNLQFGSNNHLNAFVRNIQIATGTAYVPSILTQAEYDAIVSVQAGARGGMMGRGNRPGGNFTAPVVPAP